MSVFILEAVVVSRLTLVWEDYIRFFRACGVLDGIATSDTFAVLDHVVFGGRVLHAYQALCWRYLLLIVEHRVWLIVVLILESLEEFMCSFLGATYLLHLLPNLFNVEVHNLFFVLAVHLARLICLWLLTLWLVSTITKFLKFTHAHPSAIVVIILEVQLRCGCRSIQVAVMRSTWREDSLARVAWDTRCLGRPWQLLLTRGWIVQREVLIARSCKCLPERRLIFGCLLLYGLSLLLLLRLRESIDLVSLSYACRFLRAL